MSSTTNTSTACYFYCGGILETRNAALIRNLVFVEIGNRL